MANENELRIALKQAVRGAAALKDKLDALCSEPIAIISMACRFPGDANSPESLWGLLQEGRDGITEVPSMRWVVDADYDSDPEAEGKTYTKWGPYSGTVFRV